MSQTNSQTNDTHPAWLLLVHQLPPRPTNARVKTWRRLQGLGAVALRNSVYVLPHTEPCREDFEWMKSEIQAVRGEATVFAADSIDSFSNDDVIAAFRKAREADYDIWRIVAMNLKEVSVIYNQVDHFANVVRLVRSLRND